MEAKIQSLKDYLLKEETWAQLGFIVIKIVLILLVSAVAVRVGKRIIQKFFLVRQRSPLGYSERRQNTLMKLLQNVLTYVVYFSAIIAILTTFGIKVAGLLAGAGIVGLAVGFGAQSLVKDVITGFFIIFEDQFAVGDQVQIGTANGIVQEIGLRTTKLKSYTGELHIIPNGSILVVINYSIYNSLALIDISVTPENDILSMEKNIEEFLKELPNKYEELVKKPSYLGIQSFNASEIVVRFTAETVPTKQNSVARKIRRDLVEFLEQKGIKIS
ncbi:mechanosensitive ion channel family protein [Psychrobacillus psychrodurans]|uniref:Mechanosensitive ion channel family protein n=1 Tax=Psychrobacillus psychrodurans TaxID=126157 RepID=A0A9X3L9B1_9BACI|nr:mechanosensitive ion channel family protein [Psychrobacillus psychrodurans]MCZ8533752.1 mechanosensitive ion channel family protein [Psychrobacillus psychrodurans]